MKYFVFIVLSPFIPEPSNHQASFVDSPPTYWSSWTSWSSCQPECARPGPDELLHPSGIQTRRRLCLLPGLDQCRSVKLSGSLDLYPSASQPLPEEWETATNLMQAKQSEPLLSMQYSVEEESEMEDEVQEAEIMASLIDQRGVREISVRAGIWQELDREVQEQSRSCPLLECQGKHMYWRRNLKGDQQSKVI
ncbi:unnamed protein product [Protopolystoma xenopodis]|uniref:Uncharacterized protein n=1 Tax=Protopolystoma xenopodis TaxID=117903 RepID=A0A448WCL2_9PLAT|nr:unnamed protein product [Protopolystoma xenopodis]